MIHESGETDVKMVHWNRTQKYLCVSSIKMCVCLSVSAVNRLINRLRLLYAACPLCAVVH